jgi:ABC-type oligopeptide transport system ATPase subunit
MEDKHTDEEMMNAIVNKSVGEKTFVKPETFPLQFDDRQQAHMGIFGMTGCGKSTLVKEIIKHQIRSGYIEKQDVFIFTKNKKDWIDGQFGKVFTEFDTDLFHSLWIRYTGKRSVENRKGWEGGACFMIFDDFNNDVSLNMTFSKEMARLFQEGRKYKIHAIIQGHTPKSVGVAIRNSLGTKIIFPTNNLGFIKDFAETFLGGDAIVLNKYIKQAVRSDEHSFVVIPSQIGKEPIISKCKVTDDNLDNKEGVGLQSIGGASFSNSVNASNSNVFNSVVNTQSVSMSDIRQNQEIAYQTELRQMEINEELNFKRLKYKTKDLCLRCKSLSYDEHKELLENLNTLSTSRYKIDEENMEHYMNGFMAKNFPKYKFVASQVSEPSFMLDTITNSFQHGVQHGVGNSLINFARTKFRGQIRNIDRLLQ